MKHENEYQQHIHVFRGVAIIFIVFAHTIPSLDWSDWPLTGKLIDSIANQSSIFFFFIAGYLFQHLSARFSFSKYFMQKLKTVIAPYALLSIPALFVFTVLTERTRMWSWFYDLDIWQQVVLFMLTGKHLAPLWFVPTIALFYLAAPLLIWMDRKLPQGYWLILPLMALSTYLGRDGPYGPIDKAIYLFPVYLMGMAFSHYKQQAMSLVMRWWPVLLLIAVVSAAGVVFEWSSPPYWHMPMKAALALIITWQLYRHHHVFGHRLDYIAEVSFGIFFIHAYFISAIKVATVYLLHGTIYDGRGSEDIPGNLLTFGLYAGLVILFTVAAIWLAKRALGKNSRMFIGA
jgi:surface polysaccharide O-acyltransferase-like enzyme